MPEPKVIISGGGTGGHVFPAIAIADAIRELHPQSEILFVGANGKLEMEKVPEAGYKIIGLDISGLQRKLSLKNLSFPFKVIGSLLKARKIIKDFQPDIAVGVGGYASGPLLRMASFAGIPTLIQEQNSYPGITNKLLAPKAQRICVAYQNMNTFFPEEKILLTGNPVRKNVWQIENKKDKALQHFNLATGRKTILVIGGSLGARTINESIAQILSEISSSTDLQLIWQSGKAYAERAQEQTKGLSNIYTSPFIKEMDLAYAAADIIISRAGAMSISELCLIGKPCILVPSPHVAEDHQTKNAMALVNSNAALMVKDADARLVLWPEIKKLLGDTSLRETLSGNIKKLRQVLEIISKK
jgi:UDP-N-acetylglucosamine--N-acetylmuramyl-(pentapeptide) pyrophosphoryl-undecaprenol N-acetylglucosamine transferase